MDNNEIENYNNENANLKTNNTIYKYVLIGSVFLIGAGVELYTFSITKNRKESYGMDYGYYLSMLILLFM